MTFSLHRTRNLRAAFLVAAVEQTAQEPGEPGASLAPCREAVDLIAVNLDFVHIDGYTASTRVDV